MKIPRLHIVPLSRQAIAVLRELMLHTGDCRWLFPAIRTKDRPMSDMTVNAAIRRMGYGKDEFTGHGFRSMAKRAPVEQRLDRTPARARRNRLYPRGVQPRRVSTGTKKNDAMVGRLLRCAEIEDFFAIQEITLCLVVNQRAIEILK